MSLALALNNALTGLNINQRNLAVLSHNIANANTEGYSRQIVDQSALYYDNVGSGVRLDDIVRKVDIYLQRALRQQDSELGLAEIKNDYMQRIQVFLGEPGQQNSLDEHLSTFFNNLQALAENPQFPSFRNNAVNAGTTLARELSGTAEAIEDLRYQTDRDINESVTFINQELAHLHTINIALGRADALGDSTAGLLDERDAALSKISEYVDISLTVKQNGEVSVYTGNGISLLDDNLYALSYVPAPSVDALINDSNLNPLLVYQLDSNGNQVGNPQTLASGGFESGVTTTLESGKLKGLLDLRDVELPNILAQLDQIAATLRDAMNAIHNDGSGVPGANALTGTRLVSPSDQNVWTGAVLIGVVGPDGQPISSGYTDETYTGVRPLTLDLASLNSGFGIGQPNVQTIVDEINWHFGIPQIKNELGVINDIRLVSDSSQSPGVPPQFSFDFELDNISRDDAKFYVTGVTVLDDTAANITLLNSTIPSVALSPANTFVTTAASTTVTINTAAPHTLANGDKIFLQDPLVAVNGIPGTDFAGVFTVSNITATSFDITVATAAGATGGVNVAAQVGTPKYDTILAGEKSRTNDKGTITADLTGNPISSYYDIAVSMSVEDASGNLTSSTMTYRIFNNQQNLLNDRYTATTATGLANRVLPGTTQAAARAILVDANGQELAKVNGVYVDQPGYLKILAGNDTDTISISELDSMENGLPNNFPAVAGSGRGFSHYFELNNFFHSNQPINTGDTLTGSAINMAVEDRIIRDPGLITTGRLTRSNQPADPNDPPLYTYERFVGDNDAAQELAKLSEQSISFSAAGGLPNTSQTFGNYIGQILGFSATLSAKASNDVRNGQILRDGLSERANTISGVNLDEELANTIIYQNAYTASARVISVTSELFDALFNAL